MPEELIKKHLNGADIVHHLAGITDVARTTKEQNTQKDDKINQVAFEGTKNISLGYEPINSNDFFPI